MYFEFFTILLAGCFCAFLTYLLRHVLKNRILAICFPQFVLGLILWLSVSGLQDDAVVLVRCLLALFVFLFVVGWRRFGVLSSDV